MTLVCDSISLSALREVRDPLLSEIDDLRVLEVQPASAQRRSRLVKTQLRTLLDGPFVYLDNDTFVYSDITSLFFTPAHIAAAPNNSADDLPAQLWPPDTEALSCLGWAHDGRAYLNSGVFFLADSVEARRFGSLWHAKYLLSSAAGHDRDQPAFNSAIAECGVSIEILSHEYNAQFRIRPGVRSNAKILHFFSSWPYSATRYDRMVERMIKAERLPVDAIRSVVKNRSAAHRGVFLEGTAVRAVAGRVVRKFVAGQEGA